MSNKFQPGEEMFDEVTGHAMRGKLVDEATEGHGFRGNVVDDEETEGHALRSGRALPDDEDTEGHGRFNV
jgi:hypothetical protein